MVGSSSKEDTLLDSAIESHKSKVQKTKDTLLSTIDELDLLKKIIEHSEDVNLSDLQRQSLPIFCHIRQNLREYSITQQDGHKLFENLKKRYRCEVRNAWDLRAQITYIENEIEDELSSYQIPKFLSAISQICNKDVYEQSDLYKLNPVQNQEEYYLTWLRYDLSEREEILKEIDNIKNIRSNEEEKLKLSKKKETELQLRISNIDKEITKLLSFITVSSRTLKQPIIPEKAYILPKPLFHLYTQLFAYKVINDTSSIELRLLPTQFNSENFLFRNSSQILIIVDKSNATILPNLLYQKTKSLFPLNIRFTYWPALNIVSVTMKASNPKFDSYLLDNLFFPNDQGLLSPNYLHHVLTSPQDLVPAQETDVGDLPNDITKIPQYIADHINSLDCGRPYLWAQSLTGLEHKSLSVDSPLKNDKSIHILTRINAAMFVKRIREKALSQIWNLYIQESLIHQPKILPPPGITLPLAFTVLAEEASPMVKSFERNPQHINSLIGTVEHKNFVFSLHLSISSTTGHTDVKFRLDKCPENFDVLKLKIGDKIQDLESVETTLYPATDTFHSMDNLTLLTHYSYLPYKDIRDQISEHITKEYCTYCQDNPQVEAIMQLILISVKIKAWIHDQS